MFGTSRRVAVTSFNAMKIAKPITITDAAAMKNEPNGIE